MLIKLTWLSSRSLDDAEVVQLKEGVNFEVTPAHILASRQLDAEQADGKTVNNILQQAEPPEPNITKEMQRKKGAPA